MTNKIYNLDKTNIKDGVQCIKKLWFNFHEPIKIRDNAEFHKGDRFGSIVRKNYGDGLDLSDNFNLKDVVSKTEEALKSKDIKGRSESIPPCPSKVPPIQYTSYESMRM